MKHLLKNCIRRIYTLLGCVICCCTIGSCDGEKLQCNKESVIEFKEDLQEKSTDDKYTILILSYDHNFDLDDLIIYKDSSLIAEKNTEGNYGNPQNDPKRIEIQLKKTEVSVITVLFSGTCYKLSLKKLLDNYIIDYDFKKRSFSAIANNEEFIAFE